MLEVHVTQVMSLTESIVVEIFVDHIETSSLERQRWLTRVRTAGFDQALLEFSELLMEPGNSWLVKKIGPDRECDYRILRGTMWS